MPREATHMEVASLRVVPFIGTATTRTGRDTAVPAAFTAHVALNRPPLLLQFDVLVPSGGIAQIRELRIVRPREEQTITSGMLRGVALDRLLRDALKAAEQRVTARPDIISNAYQLPEDIPTDQFRVSAPAKSRVEERADDAARQAAVIYLDALRHGSRAPAEAVTVAMDRSRGQVARYIRRAREHGWLPPIGVGLDEWTAPPEISNSSSWVGKLIGADSDDATNTEAPAPMTHPGIPPELAGDVSTPEEFEDWLRYQGKYAVDSNADSEENRNGQ